MSKPYGPVFIGLRFDVWFWDGGKWRLDVGNVGSACARTAWEQNIELGYPAEIRSAGSEKPVTTFPVE